MSAAPTVLRTAGELTADWFAAELGTRPESWTLTPIGTGQMSQNLRVMLVDGTSCVLKLASEDAASRATGVHLGAYAREVRFYAELAPTLGPDAPVPACRHAAFDPAEGWFSLVLEDCAPARPGDQIEGCTMAEAGDAVDALAALHAARWDEAELADSDWLTAPSRLDQALLSALLPGFLQRYGERVAPAHRELCTRFVAVADAWLAERPRPFALQHGDYRLDNLLFAPDGGVQVVDWQTCAYGPALLDLAYFLGGSLTVKDRRAGEEALVRRYHDALLARGVTNLDWDGCWTEYRRNVFHSLIMAIAASMLVERTERGDELFMTVLARTAQQALDLDALALVGPAPTPEPVVVPATDEGHHAPGPEPLWNESWYFDFTTTADGPAGYTRLGLTPNRDAAWLTVMLVRAGAPTIALTDMTLPLPDGLRVGDGSLGAEYVCEVPLERFRVRAWGTGEAHEDPAAILRGEPGRPVAIALDLVWETDGVPYGYQRATRYELPCVVSGTITIDGESTPIDGPGQRDHSWGTRDWWAMDWCWSAGRLDDGTRFHATEVRLPDLPRMGMGYVQSGGAVQELTHVAVTETTATSGLVEHGTIALEPGALALAVTALADAPALLVAEDGRVAHCPRSLCRVENADGRAGLAWVEWNHNQR